MPRVKLTKAKIDKIPYVDGQVDWQDSELTGFFLRAGKTTKTFYVKRTIKGKVVKKKIGVYGLVTVDRARRDAVHLLGSMGKGINPHDTYRQERIHQITVKQAIDDYLENNKMKARSKTSYQYTSEHYLVKWHNLPLVSITPESCINFHKELTENIGPTAANSAFSLLRAVYNRQLVFNPVFPSNPTEVLKRARQWNKHNRRTDYLKPSQFKGFFEYLAVFPQNWQDVIRFILHTGLRKLEACTLKWEDIDFQERTFTVKDTKNNSSHTLPMSKFVFELLQKRQELSKDSPFVFPGEGQWRKTHVMSRSEKFKTAGYPVTIHGLRRSFASLCESLGVPHATTKRLLNHSLLNEITSSYMVIGVDALRPIVEKISNRIEQLINAGLDNVIQFPMAEAK